MSNAGRLREAQGFIPWKTKLLILGAVGFAAWGIEVVYDLNEQLDDFLQDHEDINLDAVFIGSVMLLVTMLLMKLVDLARESRRRASAELQAVEMAYHDELTGLANRRKLEKELESVPAGELRGVLMLDLNDFKPVNDIFGHAAGDEVLIEAANRLRSLNSAGPAIARFGGDEYAVLTHPLKTVGEAEALARQISALFSIPFRVGTNEAEIGVSIGIAYFTGGEMAGQDALRRADLALYRAKKDHSQTFRVYEQQLDLELRRRKEMEGKLREAIRNGAVQSHFQPLVDLSNSKLIGFEALARWTDPEFGVVPPDVFIKLAEETGQITKLSETLMRQACAEAVKWPAHLKLSFNLSPKQLRDKLVGLRILAILSETGLSPRRFEIEVTEGSLVEDPEDAKKILQSLRSAGVRIAVDDFGMGYSSLYHLLQFKFDNLKIDRSFIKNSENSGEQQVIVRSILALSKGLGLTSTAEGIEAEQHVSKLLELGCQQGQGYLFGKAMSATEALRLTAQSAKSAQFEEALRASA